MRFISLLTTSTMSTAVIAGTATAQQTIATTASKLVSTLQSGALWTCRRQTVCLRVLTNHGERGTVIGHDNDVCVWTRLHNHRVSNLRM
ncbi:hypothetical protein BDR03DRAFT_960953 [Suillus americanus]|nr:hypothetical protein BDR03DRAFT_960953 [Suillus americanus]